MSEIVFAIPIVSGEEELDRQTMEEMEGSRRDEYEAAMREAGLRRHAVWHQETPDGVVALVYMEGDDATAGAQRFGSSDAPFNRWFRDKMQQVHGIDISASGPQVDKIHDFRV